MNSSYLEGYYILRRLANGLPNKLRDNSLGKTLLNMNLYIGYYYIV